MKYLIVNADDYGRTAGVARGIREAHRNGIVTSTTALMNMPPVAEELRRARQECPLLGMGVHLNLTSGVPLLPPSQVPSLVEADGRFPIPERFFVRVPALDLKQIEAEWRAQIDKFCRIAGRTPDHLDSHHHSSYVTPAIFGLMLDLAQEYRCPIRPLMPDDLSTESHGYRILDASQALYASSNVPHPTFLITRFYDQTATLENLLSILRNLSDGVSELMCHPGYVDDDLDSPYCQPRARELDILTHPSVKATIADQGITLVDFSHLHSPAGLQ